MPLINRQRGNIFWSQHPYKHPFAFAPKRLKLGLLFARHVKVHRAPSTKENRE